jgi:hypothetical protein
MNQFFFFFFFQVSTVSNSGLRAAILTGHCPGPDGKILSSVQFNLGECGFS